MLEESQKREKAILVGVDRPGLDWPLEESLAELERLAQTDGAQVVATCTQRLKRPVAKTYVGTGKAAEIAELAHELEAGVVIFDEELTPSQQANLERVVGKNIKVIDRTALILDIFASHAKTKEGRLQVRLAQNQYLLPRLRGMWSHLVTEQTRGGIGSRFGQGESQLEVDRRLVRKRIAMLQEELRQLERRRATQAKSRHEAGVYRVSLVGYTNAGKSTLLNALTDSSVYVRDELFATLDPTTRSLELPEGKKITLTDTVGFVQKLPTMLVEAFKSTLAEAREANLLLLVVDASDKNANRHIQAVLDILQELGAQDLPRVLVYNKCDLLTREELAQLRQAHPDAVCISASGGMGIDALTYRIAKEATRLDSTLTVQVPYDQGKIIQMIHERCRIIHEEYAAEGYGATVCANQQMSAVLAPYVM
ncbi:MAG: GTPase HflX [Coriobacteriales bacterium]|nr:GTPase HflX [Coriobacteriales bacterium]